MGIKLQDTIKKEMKENEQIINYCNGILVVLQHVGS